MSTQGIYKDVLMKEVRPDGTEVLNAEIGFIGTGTFILDIGCMDIRVACT